MKKSILRKSFFSLDGVPGGYHQKNLVFSPYEDWKAFFRKFFMIVEMVEED